MPVRRERHLGDKVGFHLIYFLDLTSAVNFFIIFFNFFASISSPSDAVCVSCRPAFRADRPPSCFRCRMESKVMLRGLNLASSPRIFVIATKAHSSSLSKHFLIVRQSFKPQ